MARTLKQPLPPINSTVPLVCGVLGVLGMGILSPLALILTQGMSERIREESGSESDLATVKIARVLGGIGSVFLVLQIIAGCFFLGLLSSLIPMVSELSGGMDDSPTKSASAKNYIHQRATRPATSATQHPVPQSNHR